MKIPSRILRGLRAGVATSSLALAVGCSTQGTDPEATAEEPEATAEAADDEEAEADEREEEEAKEREDARREQARREEAARISQPIASPFLQGSDPTPVQVAGDPPDNVPIGTVDGPGSVEGTLPVKPVTPLNPIQQPIERPPHWAAACGRG